MEAGNGQATRARKSTLRDLLRRACLKAPSMLPREPVARLKKRMQALRALEGLNKSPGSDMQEDERRGGGGSARGRVEGFWNQNILDYFLNTKQIKTRDGAEIIWYHRANSKQHMKEAIQSAAHMIEADVLLYGGKESSDPVMAHPPETNSDNTLKEWLNEIKNTNKGIKLDFKSLAAVNPSMKLLGEKKLRQPVWINADILPGPNGSNPVVDAKGFLDTVLSFFPDVTLSLGWTTGRINSKCNTGYSLAMVQEMAAICRDRTQPITFAVRADLVCQSISELLWLLQQSDRYTLTIWTGKDDEYSVDDLLFIRRSFDRCRVFYDILEPQNSEFRKAIGM